MSRLEDLLQQVENNLSPSIAQEIQKEINLIKQKSQAYGLVFEEKEREYFEAWDKKIDKGDIVKIIERKKKDSQSWKLSDALYTVIKTDKYTSHIVEEHMIYQLSHAQGKDKTLQAMKAILDNMHEIETDNLVAIIPSDSKKYIYGLEKLEQSCGRNADKKPYKPEHVIINGENYSALHMLTYTHAEKINCIFIDPPYNTGAKEWKYNDNYVEASDSYKHSKWLDFMQRRLKLAKRLLNPEDSVLIMAIDDYEIHNAYKLLEQTFPMARLQTITTTVTMKNKTEWGMFGTNTEYLIIAYIGKAQIKVFEYDMLTSFPFDDENNMKEQKISYSTLATRLQLRHQRKTLFYPIVFEKGTTNIKYVGEPVDTEYDYINHPLEENEEAIWPVLADGTEGTWKLRKATLESLIGTKFLYATFGKDGKQKVNYLSSGVVEDYHKGEIEIDDTKVPYRAKRLQQKKAPLTSWNTPSHQSRYGGTRVLTEILGDKRFPYPKSLYYIEDILRFFVADKKDATILDFFAGSGTTTHAVMRLNDEDNGNRKSISVTVNSVSNKEEKDFTSLGYTPRNSEWKNKGIAYHVTYPRMKSVVTGLKATDNTPIEFEHKYNKKTNIKDGLEEKVALYNLTYENVNVTEHGYNYELIAPILMIKSGQIGETTDIEIIKEKGFQVTPTHAVILDLSKLEEVEKEIEPQKDTFKNIFVITDDQLSYQTAAKKFSQYHVEKLYSTYLDIVENR